MDKKKLNTRFALLVPCYNAESYIDLFLENIGMLIMPFDEIIFYDDASTDNTYQKLQLKGCSVTKGTENRGPGYARNKLAEHTTCDWFHFHDIDDALNPDYLLKTAAIVKNDKIDVVLCNVNWYDAQTKKLLLSWEYSNNEINQNAIAYTISHPIGGINGLYKKSKFIEAGGFNTEIRIWEDADFHVKLAAKNASFCVIEEVLSYSFRYPESASTNQGKGWLTRLSLLNRYHETFKDDDIQKTIGIQAQVTASNLIINNEYLASKKALQLSELCKVKVPYNNSSIWKVLKYLIPPFIRIELRLTQLKLAFNK